MKTALTLLAVLMLSGCATEQRNGYSAVRVLHVDTPMLDNDTYIKWPWLGDPLSWIARQFSSTNAVSLGVPGTVAP